MAYVPSHKRSLKDDEGSSQSPPKLELLPHLFNINHKVIKSSGSASTSQQDLVYAFEDIFKWFIVGLADHNQFLTYVHLQPVFIVEPMDWKIVKRLALNLMRPEVLGRHLETMVPGLIV